MSTDPQYDPIQVEVWRHLLASVAEEMGATLERTAYSPNIKERLDHSCALFFSDGRLLAQAAHIPVHLGAMPLMLQTLRHRLPWQPGTMWLCNDPRCGGTHLPDITLVAPVYTQGIQVFRFSGVQEKPTSTLGNEVQLKGGSHTSEPEYLNTRIPEHPQLVGFVASRAHHADIGGLTPGSLPLSTELFHEGLILPPIALVEQDTVREDVLDLLCANSRTPAERRGDIAAQVAANATGIRRLITLIERCGLDEFNLRCSENIAYAATAVRRALSSLQPGVYRATDVLESDGAGGIDIPITVTVHIDAAGRIRFDFTGSAPQLRGSLNATEAITRSACYYLVRCLVEEEIPTNAGCFESVEVIAPAGTVVNACFPAAVAGGNVETSQRIVDVLLRALAQAAPDRIPAASQGTMNNVMVGGYDPIRQRPFAYYETLAGGAGASAQGDGASGVHTHMTNTRNTPVESLESHYPLRILEYTLVEGTGGAGRFRGGDGLRRRLQILADAHITVLSERRAQAPFGAWGARDGTPGRNRLTRPDAEAQTIPSKWSGDCPAGTVLSIQTPGGGGWGDHASHP